MLRYTDLVSAVCTTLFTALKRKRRLLCHFPGQQSETWNTFLSNLLNKTLWLDLKPNYETFEGRKKHVLPVTADELNS